MAHYNKQNQEKPEFATDARRQELAALIHWLRKNCDFQRIDGALHASVKTKSVNNLFGAAPSASGEMLRLNEAIPLILKRVNGNGDYHQLFDVMKACHIVADDLEREENTRKREARASRKKGKEDDL